MAARFFLLFSVICFFFVTLNSLTSGLFIGCGEETNKRVLLCVQTFLMIICLLFHRRNLSSSLWLVGSHFEVYFSFPHPRLAPEMTVSFSFDTVLVLVFLCFPFAFFRITSTTPYHYTKLQRQKRSLSEGSVTIALDCRYSEKCDIFRECRSREELMRKNLLFLQFNWILVLNKCVWSIISGIITPKANNISNCAKTRSFSDAYSVFFFYRTFLKSIIITS